MNMIISIRALVSFALTLLFTSWASFAFAQTYPIRVSVASDGTQGNHESIRHYMSAGGKYVVFSSTASNLVSNDTNGTRDIFLHDIQTGSTTLVNVASDGSQGFGSAEDPTITSDGRYVAFISTQSNLVSNDTNGRRDVFKYDTQTGSTVRVSVAYDGTQGNGASIRRPALSADGRFVAFSSEASNLVPNDTNGVSDTFLHDTQTGSTTRVSVASDGTEANDMSPVSNWLDLSADGRYVIFESNASNLVPNDTNNTIDVFFHDTYIGSTSRISVASDGTESNGHSDNISMSADGRYVLFESNASNLVANDTNNNCDVFVRDVLSNVTTLVSISSDGNQGNDCSGAPSISDNGRYVAFSSVASNLVLDDTNGRSDVFVHDTQTGSTVRVSVAADGTEGNLLSGGGMPTMDAEGRYVAFDSRASTLIPNDTNGFSDIFVARNPLMVNSAPELTAIGNKNVSEGQLLEFAVSATDPDGDMLTYTTSNLPSGAVFDPETRVFSWTPNYDQEGNYENIEFTVTDNGVPMELDVELITITVGDINRAPVVNAIEPQEITEEDTLSFTVEAQDPDNDTFTLSAINLPEGAVFNTSTGQFSWTPTLSQAGNYIVRFEAEDSGAPVEVGFTEVAITVGDNPTPVEQAEEIIDTVVETYDLPINVENSYLANLKKVSKFIEQGKIQPAIEQLSVFVSKVENDFTANLISQAERDTLIGLANSLLADLQS